jgi:dynein heavy chain
LAEARDISLFLTPIRFKLEELEVTPFEEIEKLLQPLMHTICLVWANSDYFNTHPRIINFMQEVCNLVIDMVSHSLV